MTRDRHNRRECWCGINHEREETMRGLRALDYLGSVRATDAPVEAICWTHRGGGWDVHYTADHPYTPAEINSGDGQAVRTKREAYTLVRRMRDRWDNADRLRLANDPRCWD